MTKFALAAALGIAGVTWYCLRGPADLQALHGVVSRANALWLILGLMVLPLAGVPVSIMHAAAGARFGLPLGMALVGLSLVVQLVLSRAIVRAAPDFFARRFSRLRRRLPPATHGPLTLFVLLLPGAPFFAQNYTLAAAGVPGRIYFGYCLPIHFARSLIGVAFGGWSAHLTPPRVLVFVLYAVVVTLICGLAFRRLQARWHNPRPGAGGPRRSA